MKGLASVLAVAVAVTLLIAFGVLDPGSGGSPALSGDAPAARYLAEAEATTGMRNVVGSVLVHFRGFDTFVEVVVIFTALMAVLGLGRRVAPAAAAAGDVPVDPVVRFVIGLLAPYVALFALALLVRGHEVPGGGFAAGAVVAALIVATSFVAGPRGARVRRPPRWAALAPGLAPLAFAAALALSATGRMSGPGALERVGSGVEAAIAVTAAVVLARLFLALDGGDRASTRAPGDAGSSRSDAA